MIAVTPSVRRWGRQVSISWPEVTV